MRQFPEERVIEVRGQVGQLVSDNRSELPGLARHGIIPTAGAPDAKSSSVADIDDALRRIELGKRHLKNGHMPGYTCREVLRV